MSSTRLLMLGAVRIFQPVHGYDVRRWATVFPFGMYAACSFTVGAVTGVTGIVRFGQVCTWFACGITVLASAGLLRRLRHAWMPGGRSSAPAEEGAM